MINKYNNKNNKFLNKYGDIIIKKLYIIRVPINNILNYIIQPFSKIKYEKYFHLSLIVNDNYIIEKNEIINLSIYNNINYHKIQHYKINPQLIKSNLTINQLLYNTQQLMGSDYFNYGGLYNNCQDFILAILKSNDINDNNLNNWIKQDIKYIKNNWPTLKNIMDFSTNTKAIFSTYFT